MGRAAPGRQSVPGPRLSRWPGGNRLPAAPVRLAALYEDGRLVAAAPVYLKHNSHGEFVFDFSWANAYADHGLEYYPKLLCAVPYSPVSGPRLLVGNGSDSDRRRRALIDALANQVAASELSSAHVNFSSDICTSPRSTRTPTTPP